MTTRREVMVGAVAAAMVPALPAVAAPKEVMRKVMKITSWYAESTGPGTPLKVIQAVQVRMQQLNRGDLYYFDVPDEPDIHKKVFVCDCDPYPVYVANGTWGVDCTHVPHAVVP